MRKCMCDGEFQQVRAGLECYADKFVMCNLMAERLTEEVVIYSRVGYIRVVLCMSFKCESVLVPNDAPQSDILLFPNHLA